jgi:Domain of Unknown Function (DUF1080)
MNARAIGHANSTLSLLVLVSLAVMVGCKPASMPTAPAPAAVAESQPTAEISPQTYEASAEELLGARLPAEEAAAGWIRLFDGHTLFGWEITGAANWRVEDGSIVVDNGAQCLLCTSVPWQDYELFVEFKAGPQTNSGVFLRTPLEPEDPQLDCYEVNIAPDDNPFPTAGIVKRQQAEAKPQTFDQWRTMKMKLEGKQLQVSVDDVLVCDYTDPIGLPPGRIGLQHNSGRVEFRNVRLRPIGLQSLLDAELSQWTKYPQMPGEFTVTDEGYLHVQGGRTQLESKASYDDFVLLAEYKLPKAEMNSGIFFRCVPGEEMLGYECQLSNQMSDGNPLAPADCGTGGIFRRQDARVVAGEPDQWATVVLVSHRESIAAWVNGIPVTNWYDNRQPNENPRKGLRLDPGTIMIQGHDPGTDALLKQISILPIAKPPVADVETK